MTVLLAAQDALDNQWAYVSGAYGLVVASLVAYAGLTIARGRKLAKRLPPEDRRWM